MVWPTSWLDARDAERASEDDHNKVDTAFAVGTSIAFPGANSESLDSLVRLCGESIAQSEVFFVPRRPACYSLADEGRTLSFASACVTEHDCNNRVVARFHESRGRRGAVVILPHWNGRLEEYDLLARCLGLLGISSVVLALPYHGLRNVEGSRISDRFLSPNLGMTIRSVRQAAMDTIDVLDWLARSGYRRLGLVGASLGSCVAGIVAAHYPAVTMTSLLLSAGDFAEVVWTGRATRHIRQSLERHVTLADLQPAWAIISTQTYASKLRRSGHRMQMICASRDTVVLPYLSERFIAELRAIDTDLSIGTLPCGHYTLSMFPYNVAMFLQLAWSLRRAGF